MTIVLALHDGAGTLTIGAGQGRYPGMARVRTFHVVPVGAGNGIGLTEGEGRTVSYGGHAITVPLDRWRSVKSVFTIVGLAIPDRRRRSPVGRGNGR